MVSPSLTAMPADSWPAVLQREEPEVGEVGDRLAGGVDAEDATGVADVRSGRIRRQHHHQYRRARRTRTTSGAVPNPVRRIRPGPRRMRSGIASR